MDFNYEERNMQQLKEIELQLLKEFILICGKYELQYFLLGGSCLGAVRHQGFIPWDDDIDVGMPRIDYECFLKVAKNELPNHLFLQTGKTDPEYPMNYAKIRNSQTTFIESSVKNFKINHGVYMDIFPLDGYTNSSIGNLKNQLYCSRISYEYAETILQQSTLKEKMVRCILMAIYPDYRRVRDFREKLIQKIPYTKSELIHNYCGAWGEKEIMPKECFGKGTNGIFEGIDVMLPEQYDYYLTHMYGNYMELPPVEKRVSHHYCEVIDLYKPYTFYIH